MDSIVPRPDNSELALERTMMAQERTLMAWIRTSASMIGFGFTVYQFYLLESSRRPYVHQGLISARTFALLMASIGILALLLATMEHRRLRRRIQPYLTQRHRPIAEIVAAIISVFGLIVFLSTIWT